MTESIEHSPGDRELQQGLLARLLPAPLAQALAASLPLREALLHLVLLLLVLGATVASYNHPLPLLLPANSSDEQILQGFHEPEPHKERVFHIFRWTSGDSSLCVDQVGRVPLSIVNVTLFGDGATDLGIQQVTFLVDEHVLFSTPLRPAQQQVRFLLHGSDQAGDNRCVTIASETVTPPGDQRRLGVPFHMLEVQRVPAGGLVQPALLQMGMNVLLALLCFWLLRFVGVPASVALLLVGGGTALSGAALGSGIVPSGLDITTNMLPLVGWLAVLLVGSLVAVAVKTGLRSWQATPDHWSNHRLTHDLLLMGFWSVMLWSGVRILQFVHGHHGVWPLKAGVWPGFTPLVAVALVCFAVWLGIIIVQLRSMPEGQFSDRPLFAPEVLPKLLLVLVGAMVLPVVLKVSVRDLELLFYTFQQNPTDYIVDVPRVGNPLTFLGQYVELSPTLSWHNANHPPGSVLLLWLVAQLIGPGPFIATWAAIALSSLSALAAFWLGLRLGGLSLALVAGAIYVAMPFQQVYSVTSMDGVFNGIIALGMVAFFLAMQPGAPLWRGMLAGSLIALGLFFTYATTQLAFFGITLVLLAVLQQRELRHPLRQAGAAASTLALLYLLLYLATGFNIIEGALQATANNARFMEHSGSDSPLALLTPAVMDEYVYFLLVNIVPFGWYLAPWGLAALTPRLLAVVRTRRVLTPYAALLVGLVGLVVGMWLGGLFIREVERIWGFVYPLAAVLIAQHAWQGDTRRERLWRAGLFVTLFFVQSACMRMLLNTYW